LRIECLGEYLGLRGKRYQGSGEKYIMRSLMICTTQYCSGDEIEKNEMDGACSTYGGEERRMQGFGWES